jgi:hypothetical protein
MTAVWSRCEVCSIKILDTGENAKAHDRCEDHEDPKPVQANSRPYQLNIFKPEDISPEHI